MVRLLRRDAAVGVDRVGTASATEEAMKDTLRKFVLLEVETLLSNDLLKVAVESAFGGYAVKVVQVQVNSAKAKRKPKAKKP